jgi:L-2,4-diaminobutyrate decarboxylase
MTELLKQAYAPENFREQGHQLVDLLADYLEQKQEPVLNWKQPEAQLEYWEEQLNGTDGLTAFFGDVIAHSMHVHNKRYMGHQVVPPLPASALAGLVSALLNNGAAVYEMGASTTAMEKIVIAKMAAAIGYDEKAEGILTSGGTLANLTALLAARKAMVTEDIWTNGQTEKLAVMVSEEAHYCIDRAVRVMGWGSEGIIKIPVSSEYDMQTGLLESHYHAATEKGITVIAVIGSACSTSTGKYDNLGAIAAFCKQHRLWFHVDGAHGGAAVFSAKYQHLTAGIEQADSVIIDFHKMMMTPALATALIFKEGNISYETFSQKAQYLWAQADGKDWYNLARRTFECTKLMMGLKVYTIFRTYGTQIFSDFVTTLYDLGKEFASMISKRAGFETGHTPDANIVCFRCHPAGADKDSLNQLNTRIRTILTEEGKFYIVQTNLKGDVYLRVSLMNPFTDTNTLNDLLNEIEQIAAL